MVAQSDTYLSGKMSLWQKISFRFHLAMCKHCRSYIKHLSLIVNVLSKKKNNSCADTEHADINEVYQRIREARATSSLPTKDPTLGGESK